jgi:hypothetical protein
MAAFGNEEKRVYHGDFKGQVRVEQIEHDGRMTVDIIASPKLERTTTPSSSSSITESEKSTRIKTESSGEESQPDVVSVKREHILIDNDPSFPRMSPSKESFSPLLHVEDYIKFMDRAERFMIALGDACRIDVHGGILSEEVSTRLVKILLNDTEDNKIETSLINIFQPLHYYSFGIELLAELKDAVHGNAFIFKKMYEDRFNDNWFITKPFDHTKSDVIEFLTSFNQSYIFYVIQAINKLLMTKKIKSHSVSGRYIMRCIFFVVKMMIFPHIDAPETCVYLHENIRDADLETKFLGRNVWLRKAWTLFQTIIKSEYKATEYPDTKFVDKAFMFADLIFAYNAVSRYYEENFIRPGMSSNQASRLAKKESEFKSNIGIMRCVFYCIDIHNIMTGYVGEGQFLRFKYDVYHQITHAPWLWPRYRSDLEQCELTENALKTIDSSDFNTLYDDSKHLHSFRASRTFGVRLPEKYVRFYDGQDIAAGARNDTRLGAVCLDISRQFMIYDAFNVDLSKTQAEVNAHREMLYVKMTDLRNMIGEAMRQYIDLKSSNDIPDFNSRAQIYDFSQDDTEETKKHVQWIKVDHNDPEEVLVKIDAQEEVITLSRFDNRRKDQVRKVVFMDTLMADIQIAQSVLRYLEQMFGAYYPESKRFFI